MTEDLAHANIVNGMSILLDFLDNNPSVSLPPEIRKKAMEFIEFHRDNPPNGEKLTLWYFVDEYLNGAIARRSVNT